MLHRLKCGSTTENNQWRLPAGVVTWDRDAKQLRLHNGQLPGGFAVQAERAFEPRNGPGPEVLTAGDGQLGYYGRLTESDMGVTPSELKSLAGINNGINVDNSAGWLKFAWQGKTLLSPIRGICYAISWSSLDSNGVISGDKIVTIGQFNYRLRLFDGGKSSTDNGQWNELMYRVASEKVVSIDDARAGLWDQLSTSELGIMANGDGAYSWTETVISGSVVRRGGSDIASHATRDKTLNNNYYLWRPVLELVQQTA